MSVDNSKLIDEYKRIKEDHWEAEKRFFARINLAGSIIRVFDKGTKPDIINALLKLDIDRLKTIKSQSEFKLYFEKQLEKLSAVIKMTNKDNNRIMPGYKWGHSTKILCLYLRDLVIHSHLFDQETSNKLSCYLYTPIDGIIMKKLKKVGFKLPFKAIKDIDTADKFYNVQDALSKASDAVKVPRVWFDDNWGLRG